MLIVTFHITWCKNYPLNVLTARNDKTFHKKVVLMLPLQKIMHVIVSELRALNDI